jgi:hypothetical protein
MSTALLGMHRPHEAADSLRSYLLAQPSDPDRTAIEERIQTLDLLGPTAPPPFVLAPRPVPALRRLRVAVVVAVTVAAAVAIGAAVALGVALKPSLDPATPSTFGGPVTITR